MNVIHLLRFVILLAFGLPLAAETRLSEDHLAIKPLWRKKVFKTGQTWPERQEAVKAQAAEGEAQLIFLGDSITHYWETDAPEIWAERYAPYAAINMGFSGDQTRHLIWRLEDGALKGSSPRVVVLMIGTNNARDFTPEEVAFAIRRICDRVHAQLPKTQILLLGIFPRSTDPGRERHVKNTQVNETLATFAEDPWIHYLDLEAAFSDAEGNLRRELFRDGLHPNHNGYAVWAEAMQPKLDALLQN